MTELNLSLHTSLKYVYCPNNALTSLTIANNTPLLQEVICFNNKLTSLDLSNKPKLIYVNCSTNSLATLNLNGCSNLTRVNAEFNALTTLDLTGTSSLTRIEAGTNSLTSINLNDCTNLTHLYCSGNKLTNLGLAQNKVLIVLYCPVNSLKTLDLRANTAITAIYCNSNPDLYMICIPNIVATVGNANFVKDDKATWSETCVPTALNDELIDGKNIKIYPNPSTGYMTIETEDDSQIAIIDMLGNEVLTAQITKSNNRINTETFPKGVYHLKMERQKMVKTFVVE